MPRKKTVPERKGSKRKPTPDDEEGAANEVSEDKGADKGAEEVSEASAGEEEEFKPAEEGSSEDEEDEKPKKKKAKQGRKSTQKASKRGRSKKDEEEEDDDEEEDEEEDAVPSEPEESDVISDDKLDQIECYVCSKTDAEGFMLCSKCDEGAHFGCVGLEGVPEGDWFCRECATSGTVVLEAKSAPKRRRKEVDTTDGVDKPAKGEDEEGGEEEGEPEEEQEPEDPEKVEEEQLRKRFNACTKPELVECLLKCVKADFVGLKDHILESLPEKKGRKAK